MHFGLVNESTVVTAAQCKAIVAALNLQAKDLAAAWDRVKPSCSFYTSLALVPQDRVLIAILDDPDTAGALGYHDVTPDGRPYCKVFARLILQDGGTVLSGPLSVSACASHEFCEAFGDPSCLVWSSYSSTMQVAMELCDPVQNVAYTVATATYGDVSVSDFVLPAYFDPWNTVGPWSRMGALAGPAPKLAKGGYAIVADESGEKQIFGDLPAWKRGLGGRSLQRLAHDTPRKRHWWQR